MARTSSAKKLRKQYCQLLPLLQGIGKHVARVLEDLPKQDFELQVDVKPYNRTIEKMKERKVKDMNELSDLARGRVFFSDNFQAEEVSDLLKQILQDTIKVKKVDRKHENDHGLSYDGITHFDLQVGDMPFELQVIPAEYKPLMPAWHNIYEQLRSGNDLPADKRKALIELHNKIGKKLKEKVHKARHSK